MHLLDFSYVEKACAGDRAMRAELLGLFAEQMRSLGATLDALLENDSLEALAREAHSVKSTALSMGMDEMAASLKKIEVVSKKLLLSSVSVELAPSRRQLYEEQMNSLQPDLNEWAEANMSKKTLHDLIRFCKLQSSRAVSEIGQLDG